MVERNIFRCAPKRYYCPFCEEWHTWLYPPLTDIPFLHHTNPNKHLSVLIRITNTVGKDCFYISADSCVDIRRTEACEFVSFESDRIEYDENNNFLKVSIKPTGKSDKYFNMIFDFSDSSIGSPILLQEKSIESNDSKSINLPKRIKRVIL